MTNYKIYLVAITLAGLQSCQNANRNNRDEAATANRDTISDTTARAQAYTADVDLNGDEKTFIINAATAGMMEVEAGKIAVTNTHNTKIKNFASMMVKDHTKANADLGKVAKGKGLALPDALPEKQMKDLATLKSLTGRTFDTQYITMMINGHADAEALYGHATGYKNEALKNFILNTLPVIQEHRKTITRIGKEFNVTNVNNGDDIGNVNPAVPKQKH